MKNKCRLIILILLLPLTINGQTTYKLEQVTSVSAGNLYVFEQSGHVMGNTISSNALQTTATYDQTGLTGTETYIWTLESASGGYYMKNISVGTNGYLNKTSTSTNVSFTSKSKGGSAAVWKFTFQADNTVFIANTSNGDRYLGYSGVDDYQYKAYSGNVNTATYPHAIKVYKLTEESAPPSGTVNPPTFSPAAGAVEYGTAVTLTQNDAALIIYTTDNTEPSYENSNGSVYDNAIAVTQDITIKAIAVDDDGNESPPATATYTVIPLPSPTLSRQSGIVEENTDITIAVPEQLQLCYTTDGTDPTSSPTAIRPQAGNATVTVRETTTVKAAATDAVRFSPTVEAIYTVIPPGAAIYVKVTSTADLTDGAYLIVNEESRSIFNGALGGEDDKLDQSHNYVGGTITITSGTIKGNAAVDAAAFLIETIGNSRTVKSTSGYYIGRTAASNGLDESLTTIYTNEISINTDGNAVITGNGGYQLRFNGSSGANNMRFRYYSSSSQKPVQLYKKTVIPSPTVTISALGYGTLFYGDRNLVVPEGVRAHALTANGSRLVISHTYQAHDIIPAGTAVMLTETAENFSRQDFRFLSTHETGTAPTANYLHGSDDDAVVSGEGYKYYVLMKPTDDTTLPLGFYWQKGSNDGESVNTAAHKAYLRIPKEQAQTKGFGFDDIITAVSEMTNEELRMKNADWFALDGRRLVGRPTRKGIYIRNGKKVIVK